MIGNIVVFSPVNYEVFQRQEKDFGFIKFKGGVKNVSKLCARIKGKDKDGNDVDITKELKIDSYCAFCEDIKVPAGGWYSVELVYSTDTCDRVYSCDKVGVGEVIVTAGQSNFTNSGQYRTCQKSGMVSAYDGLLWQYGDDPFPGVHDGGGLGSPYPAMGDMLYKELNVPIGFVVAGHGGTSTDQWQPNADPLTAPWITGNKNIDRVNLFDWLMRRVLKLGPNNFRLIIWHQGESDSETKVAGEYYQKLCCIIETTRRDAGWYIPWMIAKVTFCPWCGTNEFVRNDQEEIIKQGVAMRGPDTDELLGDYRDYDGEGIHFSPKGLKKHGELWAEKIIEFINGSF